MRFQGVVWRAHNPRWSFAPTSGEGAARYGGRFNPAGVPALYTSLRVETALAEAQQGLPFKAQPMTLCAYQVDCADIADGAQYDATTLGCPWEATTADEHVPPSWALARRLMAEGAAGIVVPSYAAGTSDEDRNLVFWTWTNSLPHRVAVIDTLHRLPRDARSWERDGAT